MAKALRRFKNNPVVDILINLYIILLQKPIVNLAFKRRKNFVSNFCIFFLGKTLADSSFEMEVNSIKVNYAGFHKINWNKKQLRMDYALVLNCTNKTDVFAKNPFSFLS